MKLEISTPHKTLFNGEVSAVQCPGKDGLFQVLNHHAPMIAALGKGSVKIDLPNGEPHPLINVRRGVLQVLNNTVTILISE
ncbi:MAG: F0F1 ATP synthase subunit epsilon [Bacteroidales bacterium]|jgi:F-type H+-transporting ATPase subunit epsilon|nr:F0F1 ATP synthase subunit epsilon [Bacteroidales bacterium]